MRAVASCFKALSVQTDRHAKKAAGRRPLDQRRDSIWSEPIPNGSEGSQSGRTDGDVKPGSVPPKVKCCLTKTGHALGPVFFALLDWSR